MKRDGRLPWLPVVAPGVLALAACAGGGGNDSPPPPPPVIAVSVAPSAHTLKIGQSQQFSATVTGTANAAVSWSVTGAGCAGAACGTVNSAGLYVAPDIVPVPPAVSVTATAQADASKSAAAAVTLGSDVTVAVWPTLAKVSINTARQFSRTLGGSANAAVIWSLSGANCSGTDCGTIDSGGLYKAPSGLPGTVTVHATSRVDPGKSGSATVVVGAVDDAKLSGSYAYFYRGVWDNAPAHLAGSFTTDGNGLITSGLVDRTNEARLGGNLLAQAHTGTYAIWVDNRGMLSMVFPFGTADWRLSVTASGEKGYMQPFNSVGVRGNAVLFKQDPTAFTPAAINGSYVFQWTGADAAGNRIANIGRFSADGAGLISAGEIDINSGSGVTTHTLSGSYTVAASGRGTLRLAIASLGNFEFALYVVSRDTLIVTSTDALAAGVPMRNGLALRQTGAPFSSASLQGTYVFDLAGRSSSTAARATAGLATGDGAGNLSGLFDRNDNNTIAAGQSYAATYTVAPSGRGTIDSVSLPRMVFYLVRPEMALLMEAPGAAVQTGTLERQAAGPFSTETLLGQFAQSSSPPALANSVTVTGQMSYDGIGGVIGPIDVASPCSMLGPSYPSARYTVSSAGRLSVLDATGGRGAGGYLLSPLRYVLVLERASAGPACDEIVHFYWAEQ